MRNNHHIALTDATFISRMGACANAMVAKNDNNDDTAAAPKQTAFQLLHALRNDETIGLATPVYNAIIRVCAEALEANVYLKK
jgi:hypothetical protein